MELLQQLCVNETKETEKQYNYVESMKEKLDLVPVMVYWCPAASLPHHMELNYKLWIF